MRRSLAATAAVTMAATVTPACAGNTSQYTNYDINTCKVLDKPIPEEEWGGSSICKGLKGIDVYFAEGDLRTLIAFGRNPQKHCAAHQTLSGFNFANPKIEWRLAAGKPIAAIQRWSESYDPEDSAKQRTWLIVTKLEGSNSCHMAYVAGSYPNANAKARELADSMAAGFSCKSGAPKAFANTPEEANSVPTSGCSQ